MCIGDTGASCHIINNNNGMFDIEQVDETLQRSSGNLKAMKKDKIA